MIVIYQKMMLMSLETSGVIYYEGIYGKLEEELALMIDEDVEKVSMTISYFTKSGLIQIDDDNNVEMSQVSALIEQETNWARYKREQRNKEKLDNVQSMSNGSPTEIELEKEIDKDKDKDKEIDNTPLPTKGNQSNSRKSKSTKLSEQEKANFEKLWKLYPRKKNKNPAENAYLKAIRDGVDNKTIQDGIVAYNKQIKAEGTEMKYVKTGSTWFSQRAWDDDYTVSVPKNSYGRQVKVEPQITKNDDIQQEIAEEQSATTEELMKMLDGRKTRS